MPKSPAFFFSPNKKPKTYLYLFASSHFSCPWVSCAAGGVFQKTTFGVPSTINSRSEFGTGYLPSTGKITIKLVCPRPASFSNSFPMAGGVF
jgi:hypothetical protein